MPVFDRHVYQAPDHPRGDDRQDQKDDVVAERPHWRTASIEDRARIAPLFLRKRAEA
jgi:hypothetical protein